MNHILFPILALASRWVRPAYNARLRLLEAQIRMLRARVDASRIVPSPQEKEELLQIGAELDHDVTDVLHVVQSKTYRRWLACRRKRAAFKRSGRPRLPAPLRRLIERIGRENPVWGYRRIVGELKKLGFRVGATTVRRVLRDAGLPTGPETPANVPKISWTTFIYAHMESILAADFFTKRIYTIYGVVTAYVLVFVHLGSRRAYCSPATCSPNTAWVVQQSRNASMWLEDIGVQPRFIVHDRDHKFPAKLREFWRSEGVERVRTPIQAPKANAFAESFIGSLKRECLNHFVCFSRDQLDYIVRTWVNHYNTRRPHRGVGMDNEVLDKKFRPQTRGRIRCKQQLGGIIKSYYRDAA